MTRTIPDLIQWHEGLLLSPQHFQQLSLRVESLIQASPSLYTPFAWGLREFEYDAADFTMGTLTVRALDVVMPDGCRVVFAPDRDDVHLDLRPMAAGMRQKPMVIHVAMPLTDGHSTAAALRYFSYESDPVPDENTGDGGVRIPRLRPRLSLIPEADAPSSRYTSVPLLEVRCEGETFMPTDFMAPALTVAPSSPLGRRCAEVSERLRDKAAQLAERAMLTPQSRFGMEARAQLRALVTALPAFEAIRRVDAIHPFALYLELCRLAGEVAVLGNSLLPPLFPVYQHEDMRRSFDDVMRFVLKSVEEGVPDVVRRFPFEQENEAFRLPADAAWNDAFDPAAGNLAVLAVRSDIGESQVVAWAENCVVGGRAVLTSLLNRRVLGLSRTFVDRVGELLPPRGLYLFALTADPEHLERGDDLMVIGSTPGVRPDAVFLYVLKTDAVHGEVAS
jgi:type VI secretion system protein ImpJ